MTKADVLNIKCERAKTMELPKCFSSKIRRDIVEKLIEAKKTKQPYSPSLVAGKQHSAIGKLIHRRHVWKSQYGRGISRIPRKIHSRRGSQFNWVGSTVASAVGGRRAHPPKVASMINTKKINKKELALAFLSVLSASAKEKYVREKYGSLKEANIKNSFPIIIESEFLSKKT